MAKRWKSICVSLSLTGIRSLLPAPTRSVQAQQFAAGISANAMDQAKARVEANFEFLEKIGIPYYCFHDRDIAPEGDTLARNEQEPRRHRRSA